MTINLDPSWQGPVEFHELFFGSCLSYLCLVWMLERVLCRQPLEEWRYLLVHLLGSSAYLINHYFRFSPYYFYDKYGRLGMINVYSYVFLFVWYRLLVQPQSIVFWRKLLATLAAILYTLLFISFESLAREGVRRYGRMAEFGFLLVSYLGYSCLILWRGRPANKKVD